MSADLRRKELYNDLDSHISNLRKGSSTIADKKREVMDLFSRYYGRIASTMRKKNEEPIEEVQGGEVIETYDDGSDIQETIDEDAPEPSKQSIFARLLSKIGIERVQNYDEDTEVIDLSDTGEEQENHDARELLSITKQVISRLPEKEREEFANTDDYQKLKELNNKHK